MSIRDIFLWPAEQAFHFAASLFGIYPEQIPAALDVLVIGFLALCLWISALKASLAILKKLFGFKTEGRR